jgi:hypothetical protein
MASIPSMKRTSVVGFAIAAKNDLNGPTTAGLLRNPWLGVPPLIRASASGCQSYQVAGGEIIAAPAASRMMTGVAPDGRILYEALRIGEVVTDDAIVSAADTGPDHTLGSSR